MKTKWINLAACLSILALLSNCKGTKTVPFEADFTGVYTAIYPDSLFCGPGPWMRVIVDCSGTENTLGNFTTHFEFCADDQGYYPGKEMIAYMIAESGDTLLVSCEGRVIDGKLDDHPDYVVSYWRDPFKILGGSGKFEGATGEGMTDDYNSSEDENSHHRWKGTLTLK